MLVFGGFLVSVSGILVAEFGYVDGGKSGGCWEW
jgi:hypothetical protein